MINQSLHSPLNEAIVRHLLTVASNSHITDVIAQMSQAQAQCLLPEKQPLSDSSIIGEIRCSCVLVVEKSELVGVFTERDVVRLAAENLELAGVIIGDVMKRSTFTLKESDLQDISTVLNLFRQHRIHHVPILDGNSQILGIVTPETISQALQPTNILKMRIVLEVMTTQFIHAKRTAPVLNLAQLMAAHEANYVVITESNPSGDLLPVGIVTARDLVKFQTLGLDWLHTQAETVMTSVLFCLRPDDSLLVAAQQMQQRRLQQLIVSGSRGELIGIVTPTDLLEALDAMLMYSTIATLQLSVSQQLTEQSELLQQGNTELKKEVIRTQDQLQALFKRDRLISNIAERIHQSLSLDETLKTTVQEVQQLLDCNRVLIYKFLPDRTGIVVTEAVVGDFPSILKKSFSAEVFPQEYYQLYSQGRIRAIDDVENGKLSHCMIEFMQELEAKSKLIVPIIQEEKLWGLLVAHQCSQPRQWLPLEIDLLEQLATHIAIALKQASLYEQAQTELLERKQGQALLEKSNSLLCATLDSTADGILVVDNCGKIQSFNKKFVDMWGIPESVLNARDHNELLAVIMDQLKHPEEFIRKAREMYSHPDAERYDLLEFQDGRYFERYSHPQRLGGQNVGIAIGFRDITEQKLAAVALQKAHDLLEIKVEERTAQLKHTNEELTNEIEVHKRAQAELLERELQAALNADIGIALTQSDTLLDVLRQCAEALVQHLNSALARIWTLNQDENVLELQASAGIYTHINGTHQRIPVGKCKISLCVIERQPQLTNTLIGDPLVHDQEWVTREGMVAFAGYPLIIEERVVAVMAIFARQSLTHATIQAMASVAHGIALGIKRNQAEAEIRQNLEKEQELNELKSRFISMASHEFRTPLATILLSSDILNRYDDKISKDKKLQRINHIQTAVKKMTQLLDDVLVIGKGSAGRIEFKPFLLDIEPVCRNLLEEISLIAGSKHNCNFICQPQNTLVEMDEKLIRQILTNLLSNAVKYSREEGTVHLELHCETNQTIFKIRDEGIGIPESDRSRLFEAFHRASNVGTISGTGLGLAIVKNAVDLHGGKITVDSILDVGTTFTVWIPTSEQRQHPAL